MKLTRRQLNVLIESLLYEASPYPYMSDPEEIAELEAEQEYKRTGTLPNIEAVEEEFEEEEFEESANALLNVLFAVVGLKLALLTPGLIGIGAAVISGGLTIQGAYKAIVERFIGNKELLEHVPDEVSMLLGIDDEVLELLDDDLIKALPELYANNVLTPGFNAGKSVDDVMPISEYLDQYLKTNSLDQLRLIPKGTKNEN